MEDEQVGLWYGVGGAYGRSLEGPWTNPWRGIEKVVAGPLKKS